jgi:orotidine-5'-phosphate decarboxylase
MQAKEKQTRAKAKRPQLPVALDPPLRAKAERLAEECGISLGEVFRRALMAYEGQV